MPERIGDILEQIKGERPVYQLVATRRHHQDHLEIWVEVTEQFFFDKMREQKALVELMQQKVTNYIGITPRLKLVEKGSLERTAGVVRRFVDRREVSHG